MAWASLRHATNTRLWHLVSRLVTQPEVVDWGNEGNTASCCDLWWWHPCQRCCTVDDVLGQAFEGHPETKTWPNNLSWDYQSVCLWWWQYVWENWQAEAVVHMSTWTLSNPLGEFWRVKKWWVICITLRMPFQYCSCMWGMLEAKERFNVVQQERPTVGNGAHLDSARLALCVTSVCLLKSSWFTRR